MELTLSSSRKSDVTAEEVTAAVEVETVEMIDAAVETAAVDRLPLADVNVAITLVQFATIAARMWERRSMILTR